MKYTRLVCLSLVFACGGDDERTPISFSNLRAEEITHERAVVRFETTVATDCLVELGTADNALNDTATDPEMEEGERAIDHRVPLEDLLGATTYYLRGVATDAAGVTAYSDIFSFTTLPGPGNDPSDGMTNVASLGTITDKSSNWAGGSDDSSFGVDNAIDDSMTSEWSSDGDGNAAYAVIDLGESRQLSYVGYRSRKMSDGTSIVQSFELVIGGDRYGPFSTPDPDQRYVFGLEPPPTATSVRWQVVNSTGGNTGAKEIQLY